MTVVLQLFTLGACATAGWLGTILLEHLARGSVLVQSPNERSSHIVATPRGGGLAITLTALLLLAWLSRVDYPQSWIVALLLGFAAALGFFDDLFDLSPLLRFPLQAAAIAGLTVTLGPLPVIALTADLAIGGWLLFGIAFLAGLWWINLFNFMDGIDGMAASQAILLLVAGTGLAWSDPYTSPVPALWLAGGTAAATAGFLVRNWPPARIFMGDVGSYTLALVLLILALTTLSQGSMSYSSWLILLSVSATDTTVTLLRRLAQGQKPWRAHRSHAYQQMSRQWGHGSITLAYAAMTLVWAVPLAWLAQHYPSVGCLLVLLAYLPMTGFMLWQGAGSLIERRPTVIPG